MLLYTLCLKKVPTFKLSVTLSNLNRFSEFLHCWKAYAICYKIHTTLYPPHLRNVCTLPWEIKKSNFLQIVSRYGKMQTICIFTPSNFVIYPQTLIFNVSKTAGVFTIMIANKIFCVTVFFYLFAFAISLWHQKFVTADVITVVVNSQHGI